jgi:hypothetical protein
VSEPTSPLPSRTKLVLADGGRTVLTRTHGWCLMAITVVAVVLRLACLGEWSVWVDEAHTWRDATMPLTGAQGFLESDRQFYPLTFLMLRVLLALRLVGSEEAAMRWPFALLGIATVPLLGIAGRRLVGATAAVVAAGFLAVHPWHVFWSQNARGYVVVVLMAVLGANRLFAFARDDRLRDLFLAWGAIVVAMLSHATGLLLAVGGVAFFALRRARLDRRTWLWLAVVSAVVWFALPPLVKAYAPYEGFLDSKNRPSVLHFVQTSGFYFRPVALLAAGFGLWQLWRSGGRERGLMFGCLVVAPFLVLIDIGASVVQTTARYAICTLPLLTWLAAFGATQVAGAVARGVAWQGFARAVAIAAVPAIVAGDHVFALRDYYTHQHGQRARWSEAAAFLRERAAGRPLRVSTINYPTMIHYLRPGDWSGTVPPAFARNQVVSLIDWVVRDGVDSYTKASVHPPGAAAHVAWHREHARTSGALFAFVVTLPELAEQDPGGLRDAISRECTLALHLPCWVGPKDESIYVYMLKEP